MFRVQGLTAARSPWTIALAGLWCLFLGRLIFAAVVIPPWQLPDEPSHFAVVRTLVRLPAIQLPVPFDFGVEAEVIASMARHGWWEPYGVRPPSPLPPRFEFVTQHINHSNSSPALYYVLASWYCRLLGVESVMDQYLALRVASLLISLATFSLILLAARDWFGEAVAICTGALIALVPQFAMIGIAVSPDAFVFLAAAMIWWQAARLFGGTRVVGPILLMLSAAIMAALAKQLGVVLIVHAALLTLLGGLATIRHRPPMKLLAAIAVGLAVVCLIAVVSTSDPRHAITAIADALRRRIWGIQETDVVLDADYFRRFTAMLFSSAYVAAGWLRFWAPTWVYAVIAAIGVFGIIRGIVVSVLSRDASFRTAALVALLLVIVQVAAIYGTTLYFQSGSQGRHFFTALAPAAALCAVGLVRWQSSNARTLVCSAAIGLLAVLDMASWVLVIVPPYAR